MEVSGQLHAPTSLSPGKKPGTHKTGDWWAPEQVCTVLEKRSILSQPVFELVTVQPVAGLYTNYATPSPTFGETGKQSLKYCLHLSVTWPICRVIISSNNTET